jgi:hypothetical protein
MINHQNFMGPVGDVFGHILLGFVTEDQGADLGIQL